MMAGKVILSGRVKSVIVPFSLSLFLSLRSRDKLLTVIAFKNYTSVTL